VGYGIDAGAWGAGLSGFSDGLQSGFSMGDRLNRRKKYDAEEERQAIEGARQRRRQEFADEDQAMERATLNADRAEMRKRDATEWDWKQQDRAKLDAMNAELAAAGEQFQDFSTPVAGGDMPRGIDMAGVDMEKGAQVAADSAGGTAGKPAKPSTDPRDTYATGIAWAKARAPIYAKYGRQDLVERAMAASSSYAEQYQAAMDRSEQAGTKRKAALANFAKEETGALLDTIERAEAGDPQAMEFYNLIAPPGYMLTAVEPTSKGFKLTRESGKSFEVTKEQADALRQRLNGKQAGGLDVETIAKMNMDEAATLRKALAGGLLPPEQVAEIKVRLSELEQDNNALRDGKKVTRDPQARGLNIDEQLTAQAEAAAEQEKELYDAAGWRIDDDEAKGISKARTAKLDAQRAIAERKKLRKPGEQPAAPEKAGQGGTGAQGAANPGQQKAAKVAKAVQVATAQQQAKKGAPLTPDEIAYIQQWAEANVK
jgi:hypothetical protein